MIKRYPVQFTVDEISYTVQLSGIQLQEVASIFTKDYDPNNPNSLFFREKIKAIGKYFNESKINQQIPDLEGDSDFNDRMNLYVAINDALLLSVAETDPDWLDKVSPEQKNLIEKFKGLTRGKDLIESINQLDVVID